MVVSSELSVVTLERRLTETRITPSMARRIEIWPLDRLEPYAGNARTHSAAQVAQIAASIAEFGFVNPILVGSAAGIIAGHGRLLAARQLGLAEVPVIVLDHLSDTQRRAYVLADNRLSELAGWDDDMLKLELAALEADGFDLGVAGFTEADLADLLASPEQAPTTSGEVEVSTPPPPAMAVTRPGDLWLVS